MTQTTDRLAEVLDCDRDSAADWLHDSGSLTWEGAGRIRRGEESHSLVELLVRHRVAATQSLSTDLAKAQQRIAELEEGIGSALTCTPTIGREYVGIAGMPYRNVIQYDCGNPWDILRAALSQPKESGNEG